MFLTKLWWMPDLNQHILWHKWYMVSKTCCIQQAMIPKILYFKWKMQPASTQKNDSTGTENATNANANGRDSD